MDSLELIIQCQEGNQAAWESFILTYGPFAHRIARKYFAISLEDIENITQNVFVKLYEGGMAHFRGTTLYEFRAYYKTIVLNEARTYLRRESRWKERIDDLDFPAEEGEDGTRPARSLLENLESPASNPERMTEAREAARIVDRILQRYTPGERQIFLLKLKGYKEKEIGELLGIPMGSVASSYSRMIEKIQEALKKHGLESV